MPVLPALKHEQTHEHREDDVTHGASKRARESPAGLGGAGLSQVREKRAAILAA